jgi:hypothetical protein
MLPDPNSSAAFEFTLRVERFYAALMRAAQVGSSADAGPHLGGKLLYAGELDAEGRALIVAGNIGGAASLAATADQDAGKQAIRDGVADFLVNSLDEALRVLKNEIRKCETVAVCAAAGPDAIEREMLQRGVRPDLLRPCYELAGHSPFVAQGARRIQLAAPDPDLTLLTWRVDAAPAQWLPKLDRIALACLGSRDGSREDAARRWTRLAPRFLGRIARDVRIVYCEPDTAGEIVVRLQAAFKSGEIGVNASLSLSRGDEVFLVQLSPEDAADREN